MADISYLASSRFEAPTPEVRESDQLLLGLLLSRVPGHGRKGTEGQTFVAFARASDAVAAS